MSAASLRTMRAVVIESHGKPILQHLKLTTLPIPTIPSPSHLLVRVLAAALNPIDKLMVTGDMQSIFPTTLPIAAGFDAAGIVESVGASVTRVKAGDAVYFRVDHELMGTLAEYCVVSEGAVALKPQSLSFDEAASLPLVVLTALQSLRKAGLAPGQSVLVTGGTGGVGTSAIQLARILGASSVITTQSSHIDRSLQLGATKVIDYKAQPKWLDDVKDMDVVLDTTGEANATFSALKKGGTCVSIIAAFTPESVRESHNGEEPSLAVKAMMTAMSAPLLASALLHGVNYHAVIMRPDGAQLTEVAQWVEAGKLKAVVDKTYTLEQYAQAYTYLEDGHAKGKIVIHIADK